VHGLAQSAQSCGQMQQRRRNVTGDRCATRMDAQPLVTCAQHEKGSPVDKQLVFPVSNSIIFRLKQLYSTVQVHILAAASCTFRADCH
jgi:hypothetical protein